jgi:hypothetical protein
MFSRLLARNREIGKTVYSCDQDHSIITSKSSVELNLLFSNHSQYHGHNLAVNSASFHDQDTEWDICKIS